MPVLFRFLVKFWKPIATGIGSIVAWEQVDETIAPEEKNAKISGLLIISTVSVLALIGYFLGLFSKTKKTRR